MASDLPVAADSSHLTLYPDNRRGRFPQVPITLHHQPQLCVINNETHSGESEIVLEFKKKETSIL